jgi:hypothetical protein
MTSVLISITNSAHNSMPSWDLVVQNGAFRVGIPLIDLRDSRPEKQAFDALQRQQLVNLES